MVYARVASQTLTPTWQCASGDAVRHRLHRSVPSVLVQHLILPPVTPVSLSPPPNTEKPSHYSALEVLVAVAAASHNCVNRIACTGGAREWS